MNQDPGESEAPLEDSLPLAVEAPTRRWSPSLIWLLPILAAVVGLGLAAQAILSRGPEVTIAFRNAEGLEVGKTRIKFKDVEIGEVTALRVSEDRQSVLATARLRKSAESYLVDDSRFWVVRPRIAGGSVSGLGTLLSGAYIALDVGTSGKVRKTFTGLETPPAIETDVPGRSFHLMADNLGSLSVGSPVYFRRVPVGQLASYTLEKSGRFVRLDVFIAAPYDRFVSDDSRFWHASGVDVSLNAEGLNVNTQSLAAIALGGIAFETPAADAYAPPRKDAVFLLNENRTKALQAPDLEVKLFRLRFTQSVRGLTVGAPVDFRGIVIGEVAAIGVDYAPARQDFDMTVDVRLYPRRLLSLSGRSGRLQRMSAESLVRNGLRAQLRSGSLITGQLYVALDFFKEAPPAQLVQRDGVPELPTMPGDLEELQRVLQRVARRLDKVPFDTIAGHLDQSLLATRQTLDSVRQLSGKLDREGMPALLKTLEALQRTLEQTQQILSPDAPAQQDVRAAAQEITEAARSFRALTETLERQPQALIRGKREEK